MKVWSDQEWLRSGDDDSNYIGFFSPIEEVTAQNGTIIVKNKYGEYSVTIIPTEDTYEFNVATVSGVDYYILDEVARYGMGYKWWIDDTEERVKAEMKRLGLEE